jgi:type IV pilus biogenesis protein CpaD/CtpE
MAATSSPLRATPAAVVAASLLAAAVLCSLAPSAAAHAVMVDPKSRSWIDYLEVRRPRKAFLCVWEEKERAGQASRLGLGELRLQPCRRRPASLPRA